MRWLVDECIHSYIPAQLSATGHDVFYAAESASQSPDSQLLKRAVEEQRILLTDDKDFGEMVFRGAHASFGIVPFRMPPSRWKLKWRQLQHAIEDYGDSLRMRYTVIEPGNIRSRVLERG